MSGIHDALLDEFADTGDTEKPMKVKISSDIRTTCMYCFIFVLFYQFEMSMYVYRSKISISVSTFFYARCHLFGSDQINGTISKIKVCFSFCLSLSP